MKIKEVEKLVGIPKANIRYYEKEGLVSPSRNDENDYREYSEEDVRQLEQVKVLRALGVSIADIRELKTGGIALDAVMEKRLEQIYKEEESLKETANVCQSIRRQNLSIEEIGEQILEGKEKTWKGQLERIWQEDITKEPANLGQLNRNMAAMLSWGYLLNALIAFFFGDFFLKYQKEGISGIIVLLIISMICYVGVYSSSNLGMQTAIFHVEVLILTPVISAIYLLIDNLMQSGKNQEEIDPTIGGIHLAFFYLALMGYVLLIFLLSKKWENFFAKARNILVTGAIYMAVMTVASGGLAGVWLQSAAAFLIFTFYIGLGWFHAYHDITEMDLNRYYVVVRASRIMNIGGVAMHLKGLAVPTTVYR